MDILLENVNNLIEHFQNKIMELSEYDDIRNYEILQNTILKLYAIQTILKGK